MTQRQLADRWKIPPRTLEQWGSRGVGPRDLKIGARVVYPLEFVEAWEAERVHVCTIGPVQRGAR